MTFAWNVARGVATGAVMVIVFLGVARNGCDEASSCTSFLGNGTANWPYPAAVLIAVGAGAATVALSAALTWFWRAYGPSDELCQTDLVRRRNAMTRRDT